MTTQPNTNVRETITAPPLLPVIIEQTARSVFASFSDKMKARLNGRQERALKLALDGHVTHRYARTFSVRSEDGQHAYLVNLERGYCACPDFDKGNVCKHRLAAYLVEQAGERAAPVLCGFDACSQGCPDRRFLKPFPLPGRDPHPGYRASHEGSPASGQRGQQRSSISQAHPAEGDHPRNAFEQPH